MTPRQGRDRERSLGMCEWANTNLLADVARAQRVLLTTVPSGMRPQVGKEHCAGQSCPRR